MEESNKYPRETIELPSKGYIYPENNALSDGTIELKYPTAREEDILTSKNLIRKGVAIDRFVESIIPKNVNMNDIVVGDKNAIVFSSRILAYGPEYKSKIKCPACGEIQVQEIDLNDLDHKDINIENLFDKGINEFTYTLPNSKVKIIGKIMTHKDEKTVSKRLKSLKKISQNTGRDFEMTTRLKTIIQSVDGNDDRKEIDKFVDNMLSRDSFKLREHIQKISPDIDSRFYFECDSCGYGGIVDVPLDIEFFWPSGRLQEKIT